MSRSITSNYPRYLNNILQKSAANTGSIRNGGDDWQDTSATIRVSLPFISAM
jgi:hypothetical protein